MQTFQKDNKGKPSVNIVADYTGLSPRQLSNEKEVYTHAKGNPEEFGYLIKELDNEDITVNQAVSKIHVHLDEKRKLEQAAIVKKRRGEQQEQEEKQKRQQQQQQQQTQMIQLRETVTTDKHFTKLSIGYPNRIVCYVKRIVTYDNDSIPGRRSISKLTSQKALNVIIDLPQDLQDMGYKELIIKRKMEF